MSSAGVVEALDVVDDGERGLVAVRNRERSSSSHSRLAKNDSAIALSKQSPADPVEGVAPASEQRCPKAMEVYWADTIHGFRP